MGYDTCGQYSNRTVNLRRRSEDLPEAIGSGGSGSVTNEGVVRIGNPEHCRDLISIE